MTTYLIRTIQKRENPEWVRQLDIDAEMYVPLPFTPQRTFDGLVVIHDGKAYAFDVDRVVPGEGGDAMCGEDEDQPVGDSTRIYVKTGSMEQRVATIRGFTGIRYETDLAAVSVANEIAHKG